MFMRGFLAILIIYSSQLFAFDETKLAASLGLELVSEGNPYNFLGVSSIYANDSMSRQMLVVSNVAGYIKETKIIKQNDFFILEVPRSLDTYYSIALVGIDEEEIKDKIQTVTLWKILIHKLSIFPSAYASESCELLPTESLSDIENLHQFFGSSILKSAIKCVGPVLLAAQGDTNQKFNSLAKDPKAFWNKKITEFDNLKKFIHHFDIKTKENGFKDNQAELICDFVKIIEAKEALGVLAGGDADTLDKKIDRYIEKRSK